MESKKVNVWFQDNSFLGDGRLASADWEVPADLVGIYEYGSAIPDKRPLARLFKKSFPNYQLININF